MPLRSCRPGSTRLRVCAALFMCAALAPAESSPLFSGDAVLDVTLSGSFATLFEAPQSSEYLPFRLEAEGRTHDVRIRLRGNSRRRVCEFLPLRLDFSTQSVDGSVFAGQDELKLVTHCLNHDRGEQDLLEEFLAYRILNVLTDLSFRVRLLRLDYVDVDGRLAAKATPRYGFLIEHIDEFERRTGASEVTLEGVPRDRHDRDHAAMVYVYEYMIGNTDWQLTLPDYDEGCCHNVRLVEKDGQVVLLPFDFDLSGLVNAQYAYPDPRLPIKRVTQRLYRGVCTDRDILLRAIARVYDRRAAILAAVDATPGLAARSRERARDYLQRFFERASEPDNLIRSFERKCI
jgi:hypothetical protein